MEKHMQRPVVGKIRLKLTPALLLLVAGTALATASNAASILQQHAANGGLMSMELSLGFVAPSSILASYGPFYAPAILDAPGGPVSMQTPGTFTELPASGSAKDIATFAPTTRFSYGAPYGAGDDKISFEVDAQLSAENARDTVGNPAAAKIQYLATFEFFLDPILAPAGTHVGGMQFDPLDALSTPYESVKFVVQEFSSATGWVSLATVGGSTSGPTVIPEIDLFTDRGYAIRYSFNADVPFGIDPHYSTSLSGGFAPSTTVVPLPGALV